MKTINSYKDFIDESLKETRAYTINGKLFSTKEEAIEDYKRDRIKNLIGSSIRNLFDYDQEILCTRITEELEKNIDELMEIYSI
jgi:hypothetical protein